MHAAANHKRRSSDGDAFQQLQQMHYQQQPQRHSFVPTQTHQYATTPTPYSTTVAMTPATVSSQSYPKGKRASLAAFDPFSSENATDSPMSRDSSPSAADHSDHQRHPVTPPCPGRPIPINVPTSVVTNINTPEPNRETFDNEKSTSKNPFNKFIRKLGTHTPPKNIVSHKTFRRESNSGNKEKVSPIAVRIPTNVEPIPTVASIKKESNQGTKAPPGIAETKNPSRDSETTMAEDLMELKEGFGNLQIPSLMMKSAPTSFLMGTGDEGVTTNCSNEPTPFQLEIPSLSEVVTMARLNEFVENYRRHDQNLDPSQFQGMDRRELQHKIDSSMNTNNKSGSSSNTMVPEHVPIVQSLLECTEGPEQDISIQGFLTEPGNLHSDSRVEAVIFQGQRNFTVIFRGTTEQQTKVLGSSKSKKRAVPLDPKNSEVEVYSGFMESYSKVEEKCFRTIDKLVDENPFCDFVFSGYSFGAALATLAAYRYAKARPMMRVGCLTLASPKVGFSHFRHMVNTTPNLKVVRLELGGQSETKCQGPTVGGWHVGHTLVLNASSSNASNPSTEQQPSVSVYKFEAPKHKTSNFFKTSNPGLKKYISTLEDLATLENNRNQAAAASNSGQKLQKSSPWPKDFANNAGKGVIVNKEERLVV